MNNNPSPGNKAGGLTTILEKSLGAVAKGGTTNLVDVYEYAEPVTAKGFVFMDTPGYDPVSATGQVAGGANLICFTTGRGSAYGCAPSPSLKLATNTALWERQEDDMDINCGEIIDGDVSVAEMGERIFRLVLATASGARQERDARLRTERVRALAGRGGDLKPERVINAVAPIRVCDNGGWTDTWFSGHGRVFDIAVSPLVEVEVREYPTGSALDPVVLEVENYGDRYSMADRGRHPLLEAAIDAAHVPPDRPIVVRISSAAPAGSSTGTSAAVAVALIGALDALTPGRLTPLQVAAACAPSRGRHAGHTEWGPGSTLRRVRRDQLHRDRGVPDGFGLAGRSRRCSAPGARAPLDTAVPRSRPRLVCGPRPGHRRAPIPGGAGTATRAVATDGSAITRRALDRRLRRARARHDRQHRRPGGLARQSRE